MKKRRVAIVGYSFRMPGGARDSFWPDLWAGKDLVTQVAADRWSHEYFWHPDKSNPGTTYAVAAGSVGDIALFDAEFFGISPREAAQMDPQQRLLLELSWEALENAGVKPSSLRGSACGVFVGISTMDYSFRFAEDLPAVDSFVATGTSSSIAANRISYAFDLRGPSLALDTACSSSLTAFHMACQSILSGDSTQAITGGVSLHMHPYAFIVFSKAAMLSRTGACSVFDAAGDGYVRSEGAAVFFLKDYDRAMADGDRIVAIVAGTAVNSDGRKSGLTVPSVRAQAALLEGVYAEAGIEPSAIDYIEAHGTGTAVGDPVETQALGEALGRHRACGCPLLIGSIKSNIGHLEAASGAAGLVKALHCIEHRAVPATIHFTNPNPKISFEQWNLKVTDTPTLLKPAGRLVIGINSFGFGGANAHLILESPGVLIEETKNSNSPPLSVPVMLSGKTAQALKAGAKDLSSFLRTHHGKMDLYDIAYATVFGRELHEHRAAFMASGIESLAAALESFSVDAPLEIPAETGTAVPSPANVALIYAGNGSVWDGMGLRLMADEPVFRNAVLEVDAIFSRWAGYSLHDELTGKNGTGRYDCTEIAQPALFALQVGITQLLRHRGIVPVAVAGHSVGEVAAAWAAGALSLDQAVCVVYHRSQLQGLTRGKGQMTAAALGADAARQTLEDLGLSGALVIAGINSSRGVTVAGGAADLTTFEHALNAAKVMHKRLDLDYAFHSPAMDAIEAAVLQALAEICPADAHVPFHSSVTGARLDGAALDATYWWRNIREPVQFEAAVKSIVAQGASVMIEVGPQALLRGYLLQSLKDEQAEGRVIPTLLRDDAGPDRIWRAVSQAAIAGAAVNWTSVFPYRGRFVQMPNYPWQRVRHWHAVSAESDQRLNRRKQHPLLGYRLHAGEWSWENNIDTQLQTYLRDHVIGEATVLPGTAYAEMALAAARLWHGGSFVKIEQLEIHAPLILNHAQPRKLRFSIDTTDGNFAVRSREGRSADTWTTHAVGRILANATDVLSQQVPLVLPSRAPDISAAEHSQLTQAAGLSYGPAFRAIEAVWLEGDCAYATFAVPAAIASELAQCHIHPVFLDCAFQLIIQLLKDNYLTQPGTVYVPAKMGELLFLAGKTRPHMARATLHRCSAHTLIANFTLFGANGEPIACVTEGRFVSIRLSKTPSERLSYLDYHFIPKPHAFSPASNLTQLYERMRQTFSDFSQAAVGQGDLKRYTGEIEPLLDALCQSFAVRTLKLLTDGHKPDLNGVMACINANPGIAPLLTSVIEMLQEDRILSIAGDEWHFQEDAGAPAPEDIWNSLLAEYPDYLDIIHGVGRVGMHLPDVIKGHLSLAQVLPRGCSLSRIMRQVLQDAGLQGMRQALQQLIVQVLGELPAGKRLRILEVGAGGPSFAGYICPSLDFDRCDYTYAAVASSLPEECHRLQEKFPALEMRHFDPGSTPEADVPPINAQFHLALVTADFASTHDLMLALTLVKRLICTDGSMMYIDLYRSRATDFVFGGLPQWWSESGEGTWSSRHKSPQFHRMQMQKLGFQAGNALRLSSDSGSGPYILLAHSIGAVDVSSKPVPSRSRNWVVLADREGFSAGFSALLNKALKARGDRVIHIAPGAQFAALDAQRYQLNPNDPEHFAELFSRVSASYGRIEGVLHLQGLGVSTADGGPLLLFEKQVDRCAAAAAMLGAAATAGTIGTFWLVTARATANWLREGHHPAGFHPLNGGMDAALWGFGRTMMNEVSRDSIRLVDINEHAALDANVYALVREISDPDAEQEIILLGGGERYVPRMRAETSIGRQIESADAPPADNVRLGFPLPGQLRNLRWEACPRAAPAHDEVEIEVHATGLNFRDVMYSLGLLSEEAMENGFAGPALGLEFSGVVLSAGQNVRKYMPGNRVVGFASMSFANRVITKATSVSLMPAHLSYAAAATLPCAFFTAYYALNTIARLQEGEKILIHGAAGGVGIAAIQLAKMYGAEIFATAGTDEKRDFLRLLGVEHVLDSRSLAFADNIMSITEGQGVDVVLNSLAGEAISRSLRILKPFGRFLELGKRDFQENTRIGLRPFRNNISYFGVDADQVMKVRPALAEKLFREVMALLENGALHPLPYHCFDADDADEAFRFMQQSRHIGKILVTYGNGIHAVHRAQPAKRVLELRADATYLVTGGLSGLGLKTAEWLADKGARHLALISRNGPLSLEASTAVAALESRGVRVHAAACDVTNRAKLAALMQELTVIMPPVRGIVHAAAVIDDGLICNLDKEQIRRVFAPKILGAYYLHELTLNKELDYFILFSSATTLFGNPGQGSYVAANACLEALAASRHAAGLPALCVRWGAIGDTGFLARNPRVQSALQGRMGGEAIHSSVALNALEELLLAGRSGLGVLEMDWKALTRFLPAANSPKFSELRLRPHDNHVEERLDHDLPSLAARLSREEFQVTLVAMLKQEVGGILRIAPEKIDENRVLYDMGFDSLMGLELATAVESRFSVRLPTMAVSDNPSVAKLSHMILMQICGAESKDGTEGTEGRQAIEDQIRHIVSKHADSELAETYAGTAKELASHEPVTTNRMIH